MNRRTAFKRIITTLVLALSLALALPTVSNEAAGAKMNKTKITVCTGKTYTLKMAGISKKVSWSTSDKNVVSISKKEGNFGENCTIKANKKGTATVTAKVKIGKKTTSFKCKIKVKAHTYSEPTYAWNKDCSKCTASKECTRCHKTLKQTVKTTSKVTTKATCTQKGKKTFTAKFSKYDFGTTTKSASIKALGHDLKNVSYKWNGDCSTCNASAKCSTCNATVKESGAITSKVTKEATVSTTGTQVFTAIFKTKGFETQTKTKSIPKLVCLDKTSVVVRSDIPVTITVLNDTIEKFGFDWFNSDGTCKNVNCKGKIVNGNQLVISTKDKISADDTTILITTTTGKKLKCKMSTAFTPGDYEIGFDIIGPKGYCGYGKLKGTYSHKYVAACKTKADYDQAVYTYNHQVMRDGSYGRISDKASEVDSACMERMGYKSKADLEWQALSEAEKDSYGSINTFYRSKYGEAGFNYVMLFSSSGEFPSHITSNSQVKEIVDEWTRVSGEVPSWYYYTAFSDWAEWSGRDIGKYEYYNPATDRFETPSALPADFMK